MKAFIAILIALFVIVAGFGGVYYYLSTKTPASPATQERKKTTLVGKLQKVSAPKDDYTHLLNTGGKLVGVNSYNVKLDDFSEKTVEIVGEYSGTTLYADTVRIVK
jgi:flagellar basal body-associated protein FliL